MGKKQTTVTDATSLTEIEKNKVKEVVSKGIFRRFADKVMHKYDRVSKHVEAFQEQNKTLINVGVKAPAVIGSAMAAFNLIAPALGLTAVSYGTILAPVAAFALPLLATPVGIAVAAVCATALVGLAGFVIYKIATTKIEEPEKPKHDFADLKEVEKVTIKADGVEIKAIVEVKGDSVKIKATPEQLEKIQKAEEVKITTENGKAIYEKSKPKDLELYKCKIENKDKIAEICHKVINAINRGIGPHAPATSMSRT